MQIITDLDQLRIPCEPVTSIDEGFEVSRRLFAALKRNNTHATKVYRKTQGKGGTLQLGIGLAANQIGIQKQVAVLLINNVPTILMNPKITACGGRVNGVEGCLSMPGEQFNTVRHSWVTVETLNSPPRVFGIQGVPAHAVDGKDNGESKAQGLLSVAVQHEVAHLYGLLVSDFTGETPPAATTWGEAKATANE